MQKEINQRGRCFFARAEQQSLAVAGQSHALQTRFTLRTVMFRCFAELNLDAVVYPTESVPPAILTSPRKPTANDRPSTIWTQINSRGFPAMTVPAGYTTQVFDRDANSTLLPSVPAKLPVGIDFLGLPFSEPKLFQIASAYENATHRRVPPPDFGPLTDATVVERLRAAGAIILAKANMGEYASGGRNGWGGTNCNV